MTKQANKSGTFRALHSPVAVIGYGNQGRAQALNLRDSGIDVHIGVRLDGKSAQLAKQDNFKPQSISEVVASCEVLMLLVPDEVMGDIYRSAILTTTNLERKAIGFAHGFAIHYKLINPTTAGDVFMVSPKGTGETLRANYLSKVGLPSYIAVAQDCTGRARDLALAYADAIGCTAQGTYITSFQEETECDLFSEQTVLCGPIGQLIKTSFDVLVESGVSPQLAYFECLTEAKLVCDLLVAGGGFDNFHQKISNTAEYGGYLANEKILPSDLKGRMLSVWQHIKQGKFAAEFIADYENGFKQLNSLRAKYSKHPLDKVAADVQASKSC
ncbi:MAG: ketol-acid reductoisomerase [Pseudomonadota bacterium]|nr:ketol-acid reductoisomerase [Pseudomonadota bacterium]